MKSRFMLCVAPVLLLSVACSAAKQGPSAARSSSTATSSQCFATKKECEQKRAAVARTGEMATASANDARIPSTGPNGGALSQPERYRWNTTNQQCEELVSSFADEAPVKKKKSNSNALYCFQAKGELKTATASK